MLFCLPILIVSISVSYCFKVGEEERALTQQISTWARKVTRSSIEKHGTDSDTEFLAEPKL